MVKMKIIVFIQKAVDVKDPSPEKRGEVQWKIECSIFRDQISQGDWRQKIRHISPHS